VLEAEERRLRKERERRREALLDGDGGNGNGAGNGGRAEDVEGDDRRRSNGTSTFTRAASNNGNGRSSSSKKKKKKRRALITSSSWAVKNKVSKRARKRFALVLKRMNVGGGGSGSGSNDEDDRRAVVEKDDIVVARGCDEDGGGGDMAAAGKKEVVHDPPAEAAAAATLLSQATARPQQRRPIPLHNFRRLSMIDLRDVASECQVPSEVKNRIAAAKIASLGYGNVVGRAGSRAVSSSAKKVGKSATKSIRSMRKLKRRFAANSEVNGAGGRGGGGHPYANSYAVSEQEMVEDIEEDVVTHDFNSADKHITQYEDEAGPDDEDVGSLMDIGATRNDDGPAINLSALNDTVQTSKNEFSILWGSGKKEDKNESANNLTTVSSSDSLNGTKMITSATNTDNAHDTFFDHVTSDPVRAAMPREESFTYSYSPFNANEDDSLPTKSGKDDLNLTGFLEEPFGGGVKGEVSNEVAPLPQRTAASSQKDEVEGEEVESKSLVSPGDSFLVSPATRADCSTAQDASMSIMTPMVHLGNVFATMSLTGKKLPPASSLKRSVSRGSMSASSSLLSGPHPMSRTSSGATSSRVSSVSSSASETISLLTPTTEYDGGTPRADEDERNLSNLLGDMDSPSSGVSDLLLPRPADSKGESSAKVTKDDIGTEDSVFIETMVSELMEENGGKVESPPFENKANSATTDIAGPPSLIQCSPEEESEISSRVEDADATSRSTLTRSVATSVPASSKSNESGNKLNTTAVVTEASVYSDIIVKKRDETPTANKGDITVTTAGNYALVPSTYEFTPKELRPPAVTKEALKNASFLFSPNNMGRAALQKKIAEHKARRKPRSALDKYMPRSSIDSADKVKAVGYKRESFPVSLGGISGSIRPQDQDQPKEGTFVDSMSTPSISEVQSSVVSPDNSAITAPSAESVPMEKSTPQPVISPSSSSEDSSAVSSASSPFVSMVKQSAVTPWKSDSPAVRFKNAKKKFGKGKSRKSVAADHDSPETVLAPAGAVSSSIAKDDEASPMNAPSSAIGATSGTADAAAASVIAPTIERVESLLSAPSTDEGSSPELVRESGCVATLSPTASSPETSEKEKIEDPTESHSPFELKAASFQSMVAHSSITPYKTASEEQLHAKRFVDAKTKLEQRTHSVTEHAGRLRKNRIVQRKEPRRETTGEGVLAPRRAKLVNPLFQQPVPEDEATHMSEKDNESTLHSVQQLESTLSPLSSILGITRECISISDTTSVTSDIKSHAPRVAPSSDSQVDSIVESDDEDDFSSLVKSTNGSVSTISNGCGEMKKERSVRWSSQNEEHVLPLPSSRSQQPRIVFADDDKENQYDEIQDHSKSRLQSHGGKVDPTKFPSNVLSSQPPGELPILSPMNRTPQQARKWRQLAEASANSRSGSSKKQRLHKRLSSGKKRKKSKPIVTGKQTPLRHYRDRLENWEDKVR